MRIAICAALTAIGVAAYGCGSAKEARQAETKSESMSAAAPATETTPAASAAGAPAPALTANATAIFAGGCFWCMEAPFDAAPGVVSTTSGYTDGQVPNPKYEEVSAGRTGHVEAIQVAYDSTVVSYAQLLDLFWRNVDPLTSDRQFCDAGQPYRSAIFYSGEEQHRLADESKRRIEESGRFHEPIVTRIVAASAFYPAEDYHQDYYKKNPAKYQMYRMGCQRDARLKELWGEAAAH